MRDRGRGAWVSSRPRPSRCRPARSATAAAGETWAIDYQEVAPQTIIKSHPGCDMPSHGRFWIELSTGRVLATELIVVDVDLQGTIVVRYAAQPSLFR